jgi:hypothetical protein
VCSSKSAKPSRETHHGQQAIHSPDLRLVASNQLQSPLSRHRPEVALQLTVHFNEHDEGGRAYPSCQAIGDAIGLSECTVRRSVERMAKEGDLYVVWGRQGRGHPNQYWMIVKPAPKREKKTGRVAPVFAPQKTGIVKPASAVEKTGTAAPENHLNHFTEGERLRAAPSAGRETNAPAAVCGSPAGGRLEGAAGRRKGEENPERKEAAATGAGADSPERAVEPAGVSLVASLDVHRAWQDLRALWRRGWAADDAPRALAIAWQAFEQACEDGAEPDDVLDAARAWIAAADAPRYLPQLATWLLASGWEQPPPQKKRRARGEGARRNGNGGKRYGKPSALEAGYRLAAEYEAEAEARRMGRAQ